MKKFQIVQLDNEPYDFLIIATSCENPLSSFEEIRSKLKVNKAKLLFDLTLINGVKRNRYIQCEYESEKSIFQSCTIPSKIDNRIKDISYGYFSKNEDIVKESVIPDSLKFLIKSRMI